MDEQYRCYRFGNADLDHAAECVTPKKKSRPLSGGWMLVLALAAALCVSAMPAPEVDEPRVNDWWAHIGSWFRLDPAVPPQCGDCHHGDGSLDSTWQFHQPADEGTGIDPAPLPNRPPPHTGHIASYLGGPPPNLVGERGPVFPWELLR